ncbi:N-acetylglucosaminyltransferase, MurG [Sesbania bispinosa]|nr:N-acetylglucosaminyltransferase, MurG [Sesbania bispinosa]
MATSTTTLSFLTTPSPKFQAFPPPLFTWQPSQRSLQVSCSLPSNVNNLRVVFAGGGTGSHVYPAVAIAEELKMVNPTCELVFIGSPNSMESAAITSEGYNFVSVPSLTLAHPSLFFPYRFVKSLIQCSRYLRDFQPHLVVGTGGYVSLPVCLAAKLKGITFVIHEPNSVPGLANSLLSFFADVIFVAFNSTVDSFPRNKCVVCGNPVRLSIRNPVSKLTARSHFFPTSDFEGGNKVLLVLGGSFGANAVNIAMLNLYYQMLRQDKSLYIIWQTGVESYDEMDSLVKNHPRLVLMPFMHRMDLAYAAADLIVSRAGAMTCYEILATGKPSILIPSPNFSEGNQFRNASLMADLAGVTVITEDELDSSTLAIAIEEILRDKKKMEDMSERALKAANPNATAEIAKHIFSLVNLRRKKEKIATNQDLRLMVLK